MIKPTDFLLISLLFLEIDLSAFQCQLSQNASHCKKSAGFVCHLVFKIVITRLEYVNIEHIDEGLTWCLVLYIVHMKYIPYTVALFITLAQ
jgi:hypothetical protein